MNTALSRIAEQIVSVFSLQYCSIHVCAEGKWHHLSGTSIGDPALQISDLLKEQCDHPTKLLELAEEEGLGVRYFEIRSAGQLLAVIAVKGLVAAT